MAGRVHIRHLLAADRLTVLTLTTRFCRSSMRELTADLADQVFAALGLKKPPLVLAPKSQGGVEFRARCPAPAGAPA